VDAFSKRDHVCIAYWILRSCAVRDRNGAVCAVVHEEEASKMKGYRGLEWLGTFYNFGLSDRRIFTYRLKPSWPAQQLTSRIQIQEEYEGLPYLL